MKEPRVGVGAVILDGRNILLTKRLRAPEAGHWSLLGGKVDWMERCEDAVIREIKEESGLDISIDRLLCVTNHRVEDEHIHFVSPTYLVTSFEGTLQNLEPEKHASVSWFNLDSLPTPLTETTINALNYIK